MNILNLPISNLLPGMIVAEDVYTSSHEKIAFRNTIINPKMIMKLKRSNVKEITVMIPSALADKMASEKQQEYVNEVKESIEFKKFRKSYLETTNALKNSFNNIIEKKTIDFDTDEFLSTIDVLSDETSNTMRTFELLQCMREYDDITYVHSLNVALITRAFGNWLELPEDDIKHLTVAGLMHDIGKTLIPDEIIKKPGALTDAEYLKVKSHTVLGYNLVKDIRMDERIKQTVLLHHERSDASGYPKGLKNGDIPPFAKIVAISDVYDAMTANRSYREGLCPFEVVEQFEDSLHLFDTGYLLQFLEHILQAYMHVPVQLSNTLIGKVVMINQHCLSRPIVNVDGQFFDLSKDKSIRIQRVL